LLTKRTYFVPVLIVLLACPAVAIAAGGGGGAPVLGPPREVAAEAEDRTIGVANAQVAPIAVLRRLADRFRRTVRIFARRIRAERRAAALQRRRELYANLPSGVSMVTLESIASCESGSDPTAISADGSYRGKYQFSVGTWESVGGSGDPAAASEAEQDYRAALLYASSGSSPWPVCG
jgi:Transglycosylase-like domain